MTGIDIATDVGDGIATVEIRRPPHNYFDPLLLAGLADECEELDRRTDVRVIVLCSEGRSFCAGADLAAGPNSASPTVGHPRVKRRHLYADAARILDVGVPIVAAVQGPAIGGGLGLALLADFRIAAPRARFGATFAAIGIHHGFGLTVTLPRVAGHQLAERMLLTGYEVVGEEAVTAHLADVYVEDEDRLRDATREMANRIAALAPLAVRSMKRTQRGCLAQQFRDAIDHEIVEQGWLFKTADHAEALRARKAGEQPSFLGQ